MRGKWFTAGAIIALIAVMAAAAFYVRKMAAVKQSAAPSTPAPAVYTGSDVTLEGKVRAVAVVPVAAPVEGRLESIGADVGEEVYEGQLLATIRNEGLEVAREKASAEFERYQSRVNNLEATLTAARLEAARAGADANRAKGEFERAEKTYLRQQMLMKEGATPRLQFEKAEREYRGAKDEYEGLATLAGNAESRVQQAQQDLDSARKMVDEKSKEVEQAQADAVAGEVHSPVNGVVVARLGQPGDDVNRSMADLFQIATDLSRLEVVVDPAPPVLARIRAGEPAAVMLAEAGQPLPGAVKSVEQGSVVVEFANPSPVVKPGMMATVRIDLGKSK